VRSATAAALVIVSVALAGCGTTDTKDDDKPISHAFPTAGASDPPPTDSASAPPLGKPREKVPPPVTLNSETGPLVNETPLH
jgi:hypothetical protein